MHPVTPNGALDLIARIDPVTIGDGATVDVPQAYAGAATFAGSSGTLQLDRAMDFAGSISGFGGGDQVDLRDIAFASSSTVLAFTPTTGGGGTLSVNDGTHSANLALIGNYAAASFVVASDNQGGTVIAEAPMSQPPLMTQPHPV